VSGRYLELRRSLTTTPLARQHEGRLRGKGLRRPRPIPWASFDRSRFPKAALDLAADSYVKLAAGEYGAVQLYGQLTAAMTLAGLPLDLVTASAAICTDEARHADYAMQMARAVSPGDIAIRVDKEPLEAPWRKNVTLSETLSCGLIAGCLERATDETTTVLFSNLVADEIHHARFGWYYLSWRAPQWSDAERKRLADRTASNVVTVERRFWQGRDAPPSAREAARSLGVLESEGQRAEVMETMEREIVPALDALGLGGSHAWRRRERGRGGEAAQEAVV